MRAGWVTDVHLNFLGASERREFYSKLRAGDLDLLLAGGDIGEADSVFPLLTEMDEALTIPICFVLGNHDFYRGSIERIRDSVARETSASPRLRYLSRNEVIALSSDTALIGHDGWADGQLGDYAGSEVFLNDYLLIEELSGVSKNDRFDRLKALGEEAASFLERQALQALRTHPNVIVLTHVPPFREACWHEGQISNDDFLPHFACGAVGEQLRRVMESYPERSMTVLCGHTHSSGVSQILPNLTVLTGDAVYGMPALQRVFEF